MKVTFCAINVKQIYTVPKHMTLNGYFTLNCHHYEQRFHILFYILTVEPIYRILFVVSRDQKRCAETDCDPQNIWDPQKDCRSFVDVEHQFNLNLFESHCAYKVGLNNFQ